MINRKNTSWAKRCKHDEQPIGGTRNLEAWRIIKALKTCTDNKVKLRYIPHKEWITHFRNLPEEQRQFMEKLCRKTQHEEYTHFSVIKVEEAIEQ